MHLSYIFEKEIMPSFDFSWRSEPTIKLEFICKTVHDCILEHSSFSIIVYKFLHKFIFIAKNLLQIDVDRFVLGTR